MSLTSPVVAPIDAPNSESPSCNRRGAIDGATDCRTSNHQARRHRGQQSGNDLNFSNGDRALLRQRLGPHPRCDPASQIAAASEAMREILIGHDNHYRENELGGIEG